MLLQPGRGVWSGSPVYGDASVCVADGVDLGDRLRGSEVSVLFQQREYLFDRPGGAGADNSSAQVTGLINDHVS